MFNSIGRKIKSLAKVLFWFATILSIVLGFVGAGPVGAIVFGILGGIFAWFGTFLFYGVGQLIENTDKMVENQNHIIALMAKE